MKQAIAITNRFTGEVIFSHECDNNTVALTVEAAVKSYANLRNANLSNANLFNANLSYADLSYANLFNANLSYANLRNITITPNMLVGVKS